MIFALGLICGLVLGAWLSWAAFQWLNPDISEPMDYQPPWLHNCPPCTGDCEQGRRCMRTRKSDDE